MTKDFIQSIFDHIAAELPEVKHVGLFNDDFSKLDTGTKASFNFPAVFLSFPNDVTYNSSGSGVQKSDEFVIRLYISDKYMTEVNVLDLFDLKQKTYDNFQGFSPNSSASSMDRKSENTDETRRGYYVFIQDYTCKLIDDTKFINKKRVLVNSFGISLDSNLNIDERTKDGVRTDKG